MFDKIWKDQIQKPKGKLGIWKPKEELKPREEEKDRDCCQQAKEDWVAARKEHLHDSINEKRWVNTIMKFPCPLFKEVLIETTLEGTYQSKVYGSAPHGYVKQSISNAKQVLKDWEICEGR